VDKYQPNFNNPRVISRVQTAVDFCQKYIKENNSQWLSSRWIDKHFGMSTRPLSRYLRDKLLICVNDYYNKDAGITKRYRLNSSGLVEMKQIIKDHVFVKTVSTQIQYSVTDLTLELQQQLKTKDFQFNDTSSRLYNPLQNLSREQKRQVFGQTDFVYNYDIVCACPQLFLQQSQKRGMDLYLFAVNDYIKNKRVIRERIARECDLDIQAVKVLINALFQGAYITHYRKSAVYQLVNGDSAKIEWLKQDQFLKDLRADIKEIWSYLRGMCPQRYKRDRLGRNRRLPISAITKTAVYRDLERQVLDQVIDYCRTKKIDLFPEHDGWRTNQQLDLVELTEVIRTNTGFDLDIDYELISL
jgi:hypothetical protein